MDLIVWNASFSVNIQKIDEQHQVLIKLINELHHADAEDIESIDKILNELVSYTKYHFAFEEDLFEKHDYADHLKHKQAHDKFVQTVGESLGDFKKGDDAIKEKLMLFLTGWLKNHILQEDKAYVPYLNSKGVK